jgi:phosphoribosylformylglycinamidine synthase
VKDARIGKVIEVELEDMPREQAKARLEAMAKQLLANMVIEDFSVEVL